MPSNRTYAIDFGTSNSLLAGSLETDTFSPIELDPYQEDSTILRSIMFFSKHHPVTFGQNAIDKYIEESGEGRLIRSVKKYLPAKSFTGTQIQGEVYGLENLIACFLREMKTRADQHFQEDVTKAVLGRPALFSEDPEKDKLAQSRLEAAAREAGFKEIEFFAEPLAAAYEYQKQIDSEKIFLVVDLGGGTSDFTVLRVNPKEKTKSEVLSLGGISVAGDKLDGQIMREIISPHFGSQVEYKMPLSKNILTMPSSLKSQLSSPADITLMQQKDIMAFLNEVKKGAVAEADKDRMEQLFSLISGNLGFALFESIEKSKREVCSKGKTQFLFEEDDIFIQDQYDYERFKQVNSEKVDSIFSTMDNVLQESGVKSDSIDSICCTGGTSKVPMIKEGLLNRFGEEKISTFKNFHSVIQGLSERALEITN